MAGGVSKGQPGSVYRSPLRRSINTLGSAALAVSAIAPTASVFVVAPIAFMVQGTGAFWGFVIAGVISVGMAMCWAELGSAYPIAGGNYPLIARVLGRPVGFVALGLQLVNVVVIPSEFGLGAAQFLSVIWPGENPHLLGAGIVVVLGVIAVLSIRINARVTGLFVIIELLVLTVVTVLGFTHIHQSPSVLVSPHTFDVKGNSFPLTASALFAGVALAVYAYDGYQFPIVYSEEMRGRPRTVARAIFLSLTIAVVAELLPAIAVLMAAPSLSKLSTAGAPMGYVITAIGGSTVNTVISLGVALAILNATLAIMLSFGRILFSSGRDLAWPGPVNTWLATVHPRLRTPWVATAFVAAVGACLTAVSNLAALVTFTSVIAVVIYALVGLSALVSRLRQRGLSRPYRMPIWPLPPLVALAGLVIVATQQRPRNVAIVACFVIAASIYYVAYLHRRKSSRWLMLEPTTAEKEAFDR